MNVTTDDANVATDDTRVKERLQALSGLSPNELSSTIMNDPELYKIILNNQDQLEEILSQSTTGDSAAAALPQGGTPQVSAPDADEELVQVAIKPSQLGTYGKNRKPVEAIQELVKGVEEKDRYINVLKTQIPTLETELKSTKSQMVSLREELERIKKGTPQAEPLDAAGDLPEDFDQFDPDHVESLVKAHKGLNQKIKDLEARISGTGGVTPPKPATATAVTPSDEVESEFRQINLVTQNPEYSSFFGLKREAKVVEAEYIDFIRKLAAQAGYSGNILTETGAFQPAVQQIIQTYSDNNSTLRGIADQNGIRPPEDVGGLNKVYKLKNIRSTYARKNAAGVMEPLSYDEAFKMMQTLEPQTQPQQSPEMQQALANQQRMARALDNRSQFAREPQASDGVDTTATGDTANARFIELSRKNRHTHTPTEREFMKNYFKTYADADDAWVEDWYKPARQ